MAVRPDAGVEAVREYVTSQAALGRDHVVAVVKAEAAALVAGIADFSEEQGKLAAPGQYSALQVLQHLNGSFDRSIDRISTLASGQPWAPPAGAAPAGGGYIPPDAEPSFVKARQFFIDKSAQVVAMLEKANPSMQGTLTAPHPAFGEFDWLEWAIYSHHIHTHDHVGQIGEIRAYVRQYALPSGQIKVR